MVQGELQAVTEHEREFPPTDDEPDVDDVPAAENAAGRRFTYFSQSVTRDGDGLELQEVVYVDEDIPEVGAEAPDRHAQPFRWEMFWRSVMRSSAPPSERWHAHAPWDIGRQWICSACGQPIEAVAAKGRRPHYCQREECKRARATARQASHRNAA